MARSKNNIEVLSGDVIVQDENQSTTEVLSGDVIVQDKNQSTTDVLTLAANAVSSLATIVNPDVIQDAKKSFKCDIEKWKFTEVRDSITYKIILTDLALLGIIPRPLAESVLGFEITDNMK